MDTVHGGNFFRDTGNGEFSPHDKYLQVSQRRLWRPDLYFVQAKKVSTPSNQENSEVFMGYNNLTEITLKERLSLIISCQLELKRYPFDSHRCLLHVRSCELMREFHPGRDIR